MVLARRLNERRLAEAEKTGAKTERKRWQTWYDKRWMAWYAQLPQEFRDKYPPLPPPDERP